MGGAMQTRPEPDPGWRGEKVRRIDKLRCRNRRVRQELSRYRTWTRALASVVALAWGVALALGMEPDTAFLGPGLAGVEHAVTTPVQALPAGPDGEVDPAALRSLGAGEASYYHDSLAGHRTASGEPYVPAELTAAHPSLPLGSRVRVTNVRNGRSVVVRINDRGPFAARRVLDLSRAAARRLGMLARGRARVKLELIEQ